MKEELHLAHFPVKEYLVSDGLEDRYEQYFGKSNAAIKVSKVSLTYLLHLPAQDLQEKRPRDREWDDKISKAAAAEFTFSQFAATS